MVSVQVRGHHTVWVKKREWARPVPVRYAMSGESLVTFGDDGLADLVAGDRRWQRYTTLLVDRSSTASVSQ